MSLRPRRLLFRLLDLLCFLRSFSAFSKSPSSSAASAARSSIFSFLSGLTTSRTEARRRAEGSRNAVPGTDSGVLGPSARCLGALDGIIPHMTGVTTSPTSAPPSSGMHYRGEPSVVLGIFAVTPVTGSGDHLSLRRTAADWMTLSSQPNLRPGVDEAPEFEIEHGFVIVYPEHHSYRIVIECASLAEIATSLSAIIEDLDEVGIFGLLV